MVSWKVIKKVLRRIKKYWFFLALSVIMAIITVASTLYVPILIGKAIDYIVGANNVDFENIIDNANKEKLENSIISEKIFDDFMNNKVIISQDRKTYLDFWVSFIAFIFDFNFISGLEYIKEMDYINTIVNRLDYKNEDTKKKMDQIRKHAIKYVENKILN